MEKKLRAMYDDFAQSMEQLIDDGKAIGAFANHAPTREMASVLVAMSDGMLLEWLRRSHRFDGADVTRALRGVVLGGLLAAKPQQGGAEATAGTAVRKTGTARGAGKTAA